MGDFNVDILKDNKHEKKKKTINFIDKFILKSQFRESTTKVESQLDHIWANVRGNECKYSAIKEYWANFHKSIYTAFKLPNTFNTFPMYNKKPLSSPSF
jgi:hypothetical protein